VAVVFAFLAVASLLLFAAGLSRWASRQASTSLALPGAVFGLVASAGALIAGYGVKGQLAEYLDGGINADNYGQSALYTYFLFDDLAGFFGWFGVAVAAGCLAWLAFRERLLARWVGVLFALMAVVPAGMLVAFGFSGFAGCSSRRRWYWRSPASSAQSLDPPRPPSRARATASARVAAGSFASTMDTVLRIVFSDSPRWWAIRTLS
jgi:hypothetical protein